MKQVRHIIFTEFEFGMISQVFAILCGDKYKKNRNAALSQIRTFMMGMLSIKGHHIPKNLVVLSVGKSYSAENDEVEYCIHYEGDFE